MTGDGGEMGHVDAHHGIVGEQFDEAARGNCGQGALEPQRRDGAAVAPRIHDGRRLIGHGRRRLNDSRRRGVCPRRITVDEQSGSGRWRRGRSGRGI
jgi:hypothetical protein